MKHKRSAIKYLKINNKYKTRVTEAHKYEKERLMNKIKMADKFGKSHEFFSKKLISISALGRNVLSNIGRAVESRQLRDLLDIDTDATREKSNLSNIAKGTFNHAIFSTCLGN